MFLSAISRILCLRPGTFVRIRLHRATLAPVVILGCRVLLLLRPLCDSTLSSRATCKPFQRVPFGHPYFSVFLTRPPPRLQIATRQADSVFKFSRLTPWILLFPAYTVVSCACFIDALTFLLYMQSLRRSSLSAFFFAFRPVIFAVSPLESFKLLCASGFFSGLMPSDVDSRTYFVCLLRPCRLSMTPASAFVGFCFFWVPPASLVKFELRVPSTIFPPCSREIRHLSQLGHVSRRQFAVYLYRRAPLQPTTSLRTTYCVRLWSWTTVFGFGLCSLVGTRHTRNTLCSVCFFSSPVW